MTTEDVIGKMHPNEASVPRRMLLAGLAVSATWILATALLLLDSTAETLVGGDDGL